MSEMAKDPSGHVCKTEIFPLRNAGASPRPWLARSFTFTEAPPPTRPHRTFRAATVGRGSQYPFREEWGHPAFPSRTPLVQCLHLETSSFPSPMSAPLYSQPGPELPNSTPSASWNGAHAALRAVTPHPHHHPMSQGPECPPPPILLRK